jgi:hypothetical protein
VLVLVLHGLAGMRGGSPWSLAGAADVEGSARVRSLRLETLPAFGGCQAGLEVGSIGSCVSVSSPVLHDPPSAVALHAH